MVLGNILGLWRLLLATFNICRNQMNEFVAEFEVEKYPLESLSLFSGETVKDSENKVLILVSGKRMAVSSDFGPDDVWRNKVHVHFAYAYEPLDLSNYTNLEKVW